MFWSKKKIDDDKDKQIRDLKSVFPSIRRPNNDDTLFELKFVVDNQYSSLRIFIPADFPLTRPVLQVAGPVTHPWLDQFKQLMNWTKSSSLVEVVEESMSALLTGVNGPAGLAPTMGGAAISSSSNASISYGNTSTPSPTAQVAALQGGYHPTNVNPTHGMTLQQANQYNQQMYGTQPGLPQSNLSSLAINNPSAVTVNNPINSSSSSGSSSSTNGYGNNQTISANASGGGKTPITMPEVPLTFPELDKLTDTQLERLLNDDVALDATLSKISSVDAIQQLCDQMRESNNDHAARNLILEGDITMLQKRANELHDELMATSNKYKARLAEVSKQYGTNKTDVIAELNKKKDTLDNTSEEMGKNFVDGKIELSTFLQEYLEVRTNYHTLNSKLSQLSILDHRPFTLLAVIGGDMQRLVDRIWEEFSAKNCQFIEINVLDGNGDPFEVYNGPLTSLSTYNFANVLRDPGCFYFFNMSSIVHNWANKNDSTIIRRDLCWLTDPMPPNVDDRTHNSLTLSWTNAKFCGIVPPQFLDSVTYTLEVAEGVEWKHTSASRFMTDMTATEYKKVCSGKNVFSAVINELKSARWYHVRVVMEYLGLRVMSETRTVPTNCSIPSAPTMPNFYVIPVASSFDLNSDRPARYDVLITWTPSASNGHDIKKYQVQLCRIDIEGNYVPNEEVIKRKEGRRNLLNTETVETRLTKGNKRINQWVKSPNKNLAQIQNSLNSRASKSAQSKRLPGSPGVQSPFSMDIGGEPNMPLSPGEFVLPSQSTSFLESKFLSWTTIYENYNRTVKMAGPSKHETEWRVRLRAKNALGWSPFSPVLRVGSYSHPSLFGAPLFTLHPPIDAKANGRLSRSVDLSNMKGSMSQESLTMLEKLKTELYTQEELTEGEEEGGGGGDPQRPESSDAAEAVQHYSSSGALMNGGEYSNNGASSSSSSNVIAAGLQITVGTPSHIQRGLKSSTPSSSRPPHSGKSVRIEEHRG